MQKKNDSASDPTSTEQTRIAFEAKLERIFRAVAAKNDSDLARFLGITPQSVGPARKRLQIPSAWVEKISEKTGISSDWLFFGRGPVRIEEAMERPQGSPIIPTPQTCDVDLRLIPMVEARISAGQGSLETEAKSERSYAFRMDFLLRKGNPDKMVLMRVAGDSMEPEIHDGDVVLLDQSQRTVLPGRIFAVGFEDAIYLKRIDKLPGKAVLKSANPAYPPVELDVRGDYAEQFRIIGRVLWSGREYR